MGNFLLTASNEPFSQGSAVTLANRRCGKSLENGKAPNFLACEAVIIQSMDDNPGTWEDIHRKCREVAPACFDGAKVGLVNELSNHFNVCHTLDLSRATVGYRFGTTFLGSQHASPQEAYPILMADTDASGNVHAKVIHKFGRDRFRTTLQTQIRCFAEKSLLIYTSEWNFEPKAVCSINRGSQKAIILQNNVSRDTLFRNLTAAQWDNKIAVSQFSGEYLSPAATMSLTIVKAGACDLVLGSYLRRITWRLDVGVELVRRFSPHNPRVTDPTGLNYALRYSGNHFIASATANSGGFNLSYFHKQRENLQFGVEWETDFRGRTSFARFAYQAALEKANVTFRASVDSSGNVGAVLEKRLLPLPCTFVLSGLLNHAQNSFVSGIGFTIIKQAFSS